MSLDRADDAIKGEPQSNHYAPKASDGIRGILNTASSSSSSCCGDIKNRYQASIGDTTECTATNFDLGVRRLVRRRQDLADAAKEVLKHKECNKEISVGDKATPATLERAADNQKQSFKNDAEELILVNFCHSNSHRKPPALVAWFYPHASRQTHEDES